MTRRYQTLSDNCVQACVASILDLPLRKVPHVFRGTVQPGRDGSAGWRKLFRWAEGRGYRAAWIDPCNVQETRELVRSGKYYIGNIPVRNGCCHAVVMRRGTVVFDPEGANEFVGPAQGYVVLEKKRMGCFGVMVFLGAVYLVMSWLWDWMR